MRDLAEFQLRCPACGRGRLASPSGGGEGRCGECAASFPVDDGVLQLLPTASGERSRAQVAMEWPPLIRIYESRLWRRNPLFALATGISFEREYTLISETARLEADQHVLDLACGPGIYARRFARSVPRGTVVGLDLSAPMLRYGQRRSEEEGLENLLLVRGNALELPFEAGRFDLVNCCGALHLFPDVTRALSEIGRVLRAGGRFTAAAFRRGEGARDAQRAETRRRVTGVDAFTPSQLAQWCAEAGLAEADCPHAGRRWLVLSATKR